MDGGRLFVGVPVDGTGQQFAIGIRAGDFHHRHLRQFAAFGEARLDGPAMAPSASSSFSRRLSRMRSEPLRPLSRARSRLVAPGFSASRASRRALSSLGASRFALGQLFARHRFRFFLRRGASFLVRLFLLRLFPACPALPWLRVLAWARLSSFSSCRRPWRRVRRSAPAACSSVTLSGSLAFGNGGVGFAIADIGAIAAFQHLDRHAVLARAQFLQHLRARAVRPWLSSPPAG